MRAKPAVRDQAEGFVIKTKLLGVAAAIKLCALIATGLLFSASPLNATTYTYVGNPFTQFSGDCIGGFCGSHITGFVTFNFDTTATSGIFYLSGGDISSAFISADDSQPHFAAYPSPPHIGGFPTLFGTSFIELDLGTITSWDLSGSNATAPGMVLVSTTSGGDTLIVCGIPAECGGVADFASNSSGGTWTVTPLPATLPLFATGLGALGLLGWRRKRKACGYLNNAGA
jgi:hypothetical protein